MAKKMNVTGHLYELRRALIYSAAALLISFAVVFLGLGDQLFSFLVQPLKALDISIIALRVTEIFMAKVKISLLGGIIIALPVILMQFGGFILPGLNPGERRLAYLLVPAATLLFAGGGAFAYYAAIPVGMKFLLAMAGDEVVPMIALKEYLSFVLSFMLSLGLVFQMPVAVLILSRIGIVNSGLLRRKRKFAVLGIFIIAAILTGPDVFSQVIMAFPMLVLYEISVWVSMMVENSRRKIVNNLGGA